MIAVLLLSLSFWTSSEAKLSEIKQIKQIKQIKANKEDDEQINCN
jgi:hypothetical protein